MSKTFGKLLCPLLISIKGGWPEWAKRGSESVGCDKDVAQSIVALHATQDLDGGRSW